MAGLRWGILGTARINRRLVPGIRAAGDRLVMIGSRDAERGQAMASELGAERTGSYEDVLAAADVDAVYISLPNGLHAPWTLRAAEARKHVLCEKPMATTVQDCGAMAAACARHGVHLVEAFMYRHHPQWDAVWEVVRSESFGAIRVMRVAFGFNLQRPGDIRLSPELGGGCLQDVGCYCVNVTRWFLGEPDRVLGVTRDPRGVGVDTHAAATLEFNSGALALLECSFESAGHQEVTIIGERGRIDVEPAFLTRGDPRLRVRDAQGERVITVPDADPYAREVMAFDRLVTEGAPLSTTAEDAVRTQRVLAAWRSGSTAAS
ncbi:MAG: Gfo/Idh/MocA family oxidoreductase [Chloroflexi bacterium]|nr:Gfo/Idh/MocA family oxidoreductase [Chloroflexota bacterium]